ncbi:MAG: hypothetical protein EA385_16635 [Salinarimonadaceae bacterium]|nr:MAG: hypothetical protein EA385_16635 [Salinarimonadaceae bacterium]
MSVTHQSLLDAMDGIAIVLDEELRISQIGKTNWEKFIDDNPPPQDAAPRNLTNESVVGLPITDFFAGDAVRATFGDLFKKVLGGARPAVQIDYRCDAPELRRDMRLSVSPIITGADKRYLLYQSVTLAVQQRPKLPLFCAPVADQEAEDILTLCAICARVAWPIGAPTGAREWIDSAEYYRRDGEEVAVISHGFFEECFARLQDED